MALQIRRGSNAEWEAGKDNIIAGEPAVALDTKRVFVGTANGEYTELANKDIVDPIIDRMGLGLITDYTIGEYVTVESGVWVTYTNPSFKWAVVPCEGGDYFTITVGGWSAFYNAFFTDSNGNYIQTTFPPGYENVVVTAPEGAAYFYINNQVDDSYNNYRGDWSETVLERLENPYIPINSITTEKIVDEAVTTNKLADGAVSEDKIQDGAVTRDKIGGNAVGDAELDYDAVATNRIQDGAVTEEKLADSAVTTDKLADESVTLAKLANEVTESLVKPDGTYDSMTVGTSKQLLSDTYVENKVPYFFRASQAIGDRLDDTIVGGTLAVNQLVDTNTSSVTAESGHKLYTKISGTESIVASDGSAISVSSDDKVIDLTAMFGSAIADYALTAGVDWIKPFIPDNLPYMLPTLESVSVSAHVLRDADDNIIGKYPLDTTTLRGVPKLDANNNIYFDGDLYPSSGDGKARYIEVDLGDLDWYYQSSLGKFFVVLADGKISASSKGLPTVSDAYVVDATNPFSSMTDKTMIVGCNFVSSSTCAVVVYDASYTDATTFKNAMSGKKLVYELATPTDLALTPFHNPQICSQYGTEEYVTEGLVPVGHDTKYFEDLRGKIEDLPSLPTSNGEYKLKITDGVASWVSI